LPTFFFLGGGVKRAYWITPAGKVVKSLSDLKISLLSVDEKIIKRDNETKCFDFVSFHELAPPEPFLDI
jgi:hypothetical protein